MLAMSNLQAASTFNLDGWPRAGCPRSICPRLPTLYTGHSRLLARSCRRSLPRKHFTLGPRLFYLLFPEADLNFRLFVRSPCGTPVLYSSSPSPSPSLLETLPTALFAPSLFWLSRLQTCAVSCHA